MGSEATPLMLTIPEHYASSDDDDDDTSFTRVHHSRRQQSTITSSSSATKGRGSFFSFGSALLNFTTNNNNDKQQQQQHHSGQHRRSPSSSMFDFGSTIMRELSHEFIDYEESESVALNALFSIVAQPTADEEQHMRHLTLIQKSFSPLLLP